LVTQARQAEAHTEETITNHKLSEANVAKSGHEAEAIAIEEHDPV
jgi:hypothetical protein